MQTVFDVSYYGQDTGTRRSRHGMTWTQEELDRLRLLFLGGDSFRQICEKMERPSKGVLPKLEGLGLVTQRNDGVYYRAGEGEQSPPPVRLVAGISVDRACRLTIREPLKAPLVVHAIPGKPVHVTTSSPSFFAASVSSSIACVIRVRQNGKDVTVCPITPGDDVAVTEDPKSFYGAPVWDDYSKIEQRVTSAWSVPNPPEREQLTAGTIEKWWRANYPDSSTSITNKEKAMAPNIETKTFVRGQDAASITDDGLYEIIRSIQSQITSLTEINPKPERLVAKIKSLREDADAIVKYVDTREGK